MHAGRVPPNKGRLAMKERGKQRGFFRWQLGSAHSGKLRLRGNLHCCDAGERWCSAAGGNDPGQCCSICRQQTFFGHTLRYCGGRGRSDLWRQHRFLGRPPIWYVVAFEMGISDRARRTEEEAGTVSICSPRREDRLLRTFRRFAARLCGTAGWSKWIVPFAVPHLSMRRGELPGRQCSELADTCLEKVFVESLDHLDGRCLLQRSFWPSFFGATTRKMRNDSWTRQKQRRRMMPGNNRVGAGQVAANVLMAETPHVDLCGSGLPLRLR